MQLSSVSSLLTFSKTKEAVFAIFLVANFTVLAGNNHLQAQNSDLGEVYLENSGSKEAQPDFIRGLAWLHSFWYEKAAGLFREAQAIDPDFAMAYWGEAMCHNAPIWNDQDIDKAREILNRLAPTPEERLQKAKFPTEKGLLKAVETLYGEGDKLGRDIAYSEAMKNLHDTYPYDPEIATFYSLSLQGRQRRGNLDQRILMQSAAVAQEVFSKHPNHPGAAHYLIHAVDDPIHAPLGLQAARSFAKIAPASDHALHMPSHIFLVLGRWDDSVSSDEAAHAAEDAMVERGEITTAERSFHSLNWLSYTYPQQGRFKKAKETVEIIKEKEKKSPDKHTKAMSGVIESIYTIQTRDWKKLPLPEKTNEASRYSYHEAAQNFAAGMSAFHLGDMSTAIKAMNRLRELKEFSESKGDANRAKYRNIMQNEIAALIQKSKGNVDECLSLLKTAAEMEAGMDFPKIPSSIKPAPELYGEILLELQKAETAAKQFRISLNRTPNRSASVLGLARTAVMMGDTDTAYKNYLQFLQNWHNADPDLPELEEARKFVEQHSETAKNKKVARMFEDSLPSEDKFALTLTSDGQTLYFTRGLRDGGGIFESTQHDGKWSKPHQLPFSSGDYNDNDLFPSPEGSKYFFMSKRPITGTVLQKEQDIWVVEKNGSSWGEPVHLGPVVNSDARDGFPSVASDGTLYFFSERAGGLGSADIYRSRFVHGEFMAPENLGSAINTEHWDGLPYISPDKKVLIFFSDRPGGYGGGDLYVSYHRNDSWSEPENLGPLVNTKETEVTPYLNPDGK